MGQSGPSWQQPEQAPGAWQQPEPAAQTWQPHPGSQTRQQPPAVQNQGWQQPAQPGPTWQQPSGQPGVPARNGQWAAGPWVDRTPAGPAIEPLSLPVGQQVHSQCTITMSYVSAAMWFLSGLLFLGLAFLPVWLDSGDFGWMWVFIAALFWLNAFLFLGMAKSECFADNQNITKTGLYGWTAAWSDVTQVILTRRGAYTGFILMERPEVSQQRRNRWLIRGLGAPKNSVGVTILNSQVAPFVRLAAAHQIPVQERGIGLGARTR